MNHSTKTTITETTTTRTTPVEIQQPVQIVEPVAIQPVKTTEKTIERLPDGSLRTTEVKTTNNSTSTSPHDSLEAKVLQEKKDRGML